MQFAFCNLHFEMHTRRSTGFRRTRRSTEGGWRRRNIVERRLNENGDQMIIETRKMGKWRRWLAKVYLPDTGRTLNEELIEKGLAKSIEEHAGGR